MKHGILIVSLLLLLSGCASGGAKSLDGQTNATISQKIHKGDSKEQVTAAFGPPSDVSFTDGGNEVWKYEFLDLKSKPTNFIPVVNLFSQGYEGKKNLLIIYFEQDERVGKYSFSISDHDISQGIMGGGKGSAQ